MKKFRFAIFSIFIVCVFISIYFFNRDLYQINSYIQTDTLSTLDALSSATIPQYVLRTYQNDSKQACIDIDLTRFQVEDNHSIHFSVFINNSSVGRAYIHQSIIASFDPIWIVCIDISMLPSGEYLSELRFQPNPSSVMIIYQWAIKIEPTPTPS